ncbi:hypothetical protein GCM10011297_06510 [Bacterioplanes sanyensis]|uniref:Ig-like domain-containing protein n=1 Tax=Bacterioplanes sanyensis TaxID=1249553 RepID=UPI00167A9457|nr:Ig-like domain-containing protein [Bacterioplanes sanyensis]GGY36134.1 hypothetical protein GCM10011297_06510 [Bacterioplanes sanyensis]
MYKPMTLLALLLAGFLTACGGSDGGSVVQGGDGTAGSEDTGGTDDVTTGTEIAAPRLGTGVGSSFNEGALEATVTNLSAGGTTQIKANIVDSDSGNRKIVSKPYAVVFSSRCSGADPAQAVFSKDEIITSSGEVVVTYEARGCRDQDVVTFRLYDTSEEGGGRTGDALHTATTVLTVEPPETGAIEFATAEPSSISVSGIANTSLPKLSRVTFRVLDNNANPISGKQVDFELTNASGGITLSLDSAVTNEAGEAFTILRSGTSHAITSVKATTTTNDGTVISTESAPISVTTGLPRQDKFSISAEVLNPGAYNKDNVEVGITAAAADALGNPVPDGTQFNFITENGRIGGDSNSGSCTVSNGAGSCSVTWRSSGIRPFFEGSHPDGLQTVNERIAMTTIVAYTLGESGFTDQNANYLYDPGEPFVSWPEVYVDDNFNGEIDKGTNGKPVEAFIDIGNVGSYDEAPTVYQGVQCTQAARDQGHCPPGLVHVRDSLRIVQSVYDSVVIRFFFQRNGTWTEVSPREINLEDELDDESKRGVFYVVLQDANGNIPESGTSLAVSGEGYEVFGASGDVPNTIGKLSVPGLPAYGAAYIVRYKPEPDAEGERKIEFTAPSGSGGLTAKERLDGTVPPPEDEDGNNTP